MSAVAWRVGGGERSQPWTCVFPSVLHSQEGKWEGLYPNRVPVQAWQASCSSQTLPWCWRGAVARQGTKPWKETPSPTQRRSVASVWSEAGVGMATSATPHRQHSGSAQFKDPSELRLYPAPASWKWLGGLPCPLPALPLWAGPAESRVLPPQGRLLTGAHPSPLFSP